MSHKDKVLGVSEQIRQISRLKQPVKIQKKGISHFVPNPYDKRKKLPRVDIGSLNEILNIDTENMICTAEPGVTFSDLVEKLQPLGLIPYTVPELKTITLGGAVSGCSVESMSYKYGGFHDSCTEYEIVTGTGEIINCSPKNNPDIFQMIHGSYGTLGILTKLTFRLLPAKPYVKMDYVRFSTLETFWKFLEERCAANDNDFIDAIIHSDDNFIVCLGNMVESAPYTSKYDWLDIYYKSTRKRSEDYLKLYDYFFRYDAECHWITSTVPLLETKPVRFLAGKVFLGSTNMIKWSKRLNTLMKLKRRPDVVVDLFIPSLRFEDFFRWYKNEFRHYPLWIVPYKMPTAYPWINRDYAKNIGENFFIDCAIYGKRNGERNKDYSEILEKKTHELGGIKTLISSNHYDEATFWQVYDRENYRAIKKKTDPSGIFSDLYKKFSPENYR